MTAPEFDPTSTIRLSEALRVCEEHLDAEGGEVWITRRIMDGLSGLARVTPTANPAPAAGVSEAEVEAGMKRIQNGCDVTPKEMRAALEAAALARQPAHDAGQGAKPVAWQWRYEQTDGDWSAWIHGGDDEQRAYLANSQHHEVRPLYAAPQAPVPRGQSDGWRPIESAPKDGTEIDLWIAPLSEDGHPLTPCRVPDAHFHCGDWLTWSGFAEVGHQKVEHRPTHWRPLPAPPGTASSPAPSNAGEDDGAFMEEAILAACKAYEKVIGGTYIADFGGMRRALAAARRGLQPPPAPSTEAIACFLARQAGVDPDRVGAFDNGHPDEPAWRQFETRAAELRAFLGAAPAGPEVTEAAEGTSDADLAQALLDMIANNYGAPFHERIPRAAKLLMRAASRHLAAAALRAGTGR